MTPRKSDRDVHEMLYAKISTIDTKTDQMLTTLATLAESVRWMKLAVVGVYAAIGATVAKVVVATIR